MLLLRPLPLNASTFSADTCTVSSEMTALQLQFGMAHSLVAVLHVSRLLTRPAHFFGEGVQIEHEVEQVGLLEAREEAECQRPSLLIAEPQGRPGQPQGARCLQGLPRQHQGLLLQSQFEEVAR